MVRTYDVLALPTSSRWGGTLIGVYVNERGPQYNLLDTIFSATDEGVLSLAAIRDAAGRPFDFQIVHLNEGASRLLKLPSTELLWRRLSAGGNLLCSPDVIERLLDIIDSGTGGQFEIDSDDRNLRLGATAFGDILSLTVSDVTALEAARSLVPPAVRQQSDADVGVRCRDHAIPRASTTRPSSITATPAKHSWP